MYQNNGIEKAEKAVTCQHNKVSTGTVKETTELVITTLVRKDRINLDAMLPLIKLHGDSYTPLKKAILYSTLAHRVRKSIIHIIDQKADLRIPVMLCLPSGYGKKEFKIFIMNNTPSEPSRSQTYCEPTSLHPEQLVGRTNSRYLPRSGVIKYEKVYGFLASSFLVFDEAVQLLVDERFDDAIKYVRIALDTLGDNPVIKRLTGIPQEQEIRYYPDCSIVFFFQPVGTKGSDKLPHELLSEGLLRRFLVPYTRITDKERSKAYALSEKPVDAKEANQLWENAVKNIDSLSTDQTVDWDINDVIHGLFTKNNELIEIGKKRGGQCAEFCNMGMFDLLKHLARMSCVQAGMNRRTKVTSEDVEIALSDLTEIWNLHLNFVAEMIRESAGSWREQKLIGHLKVLNDAGCVDESSSSMSIGQFQETIGDKDGNIYRQLKEKGLVEGRQKGKNNSRIWLTKIGVEKAKEYGL